MPQLKLYGAFRSGTNFLQAVMELNYHVTCLGSEGGWKHTVPPIAFHEGRYAPGPHPVAVLVKNPFAALTSMYRYFKARRFTNASCGETWDTFLTQRFTIFDAKQPGMPRLRFANPVQYWNHVYYAWWSMSEERRAVVRYETLLADPDLVTSRLAKGFSFERRSETLIVPSRTVHRLTDTWDRSALADYEETATFKGRPYYLSGEYAREFSVDQAMFVAGELDPELLVHLGYPDAIDQVIARLTIGAEA